ncbi:hotdog fold domain-containing protein [Maricurvus nonylphenolicus]|uniref:hotdog fold domain-containing protein n=1 Tax=Maricurvus nonylphenolicus TaxID=1008307 RepID=UPI0036F44837
MRPVLTMFEQMGSEPFSQAVGQMAPYFASIDPEVTELKEGYCCALLKNQPKVHNHLATVHAIAMCNAAELVAGLTTDASISEDAQWIPQAMSVKYLAKAKTDLTVICDAKDVDFSQAGEILVPVSAVDTDGKECFSAQITMNVKNP